MKNQKQIADKLTTLTRDVITINTVTKIIKITEIKKRDVIVMIAGTRKDK